MACVCVCVFPEKCIEKTEIQKDFIRSKIVKRHITSYNFGPDLDPESNKIKLFHKQKLYKVIKIMDTDCIFDVVK